MISLIAFVAGSLLFSLGAIHIYWGFGGKWGGKAALPARSDGKPLFQPTRFDTFAVAILLMLAAHLIFTLGSLQKGLFPSWVYVCGGWAIAAVFVIRAIGEFRWLGLFKKHKGSLFARLDTWLYSPLCLVLGVMVLLIMLRTSFS
jgi:hypothetical protein